jgi:ATP-binding cassette subfamily B protein
MPRRSSPPSKNKKKLTTAEYARAVLQVMKTTFRAAPLAIVVQVIGAIIGAVLPIATTFFAAATTSELALAYAGREGAGDKAVIYVAITAVLGIAMTAWRSFESYLTQSMRYKVESAMTDQMYEHFLSLDFWRYDDKQTADLYEKARRFAQFFPYIFDRLTSALTATFSMIAGVAALLLVNWWLALIALAAIIPGFFVQLRLSRLQTNHWKGNVLIRRAIGRIEWEIMDPVPISQIRLLGLVRSLLTLRQTYRDKDEKQRIEFERSFVWKKLGADALEAAAEVTALIWITLQIISREQPVGQFLYVQQMMSRATGGAASVLSTISSLDEDLANLFEYQEFMALPAGTANGKVLKKVPGRIDVKSVSFHYPGLDQEVLNNVSFTIERGQHIVIVGENGAGKSTLVKLLTGLYSPTKGLISVDGISLAEVDLTSWHKHLSVLGQDFVRFNFATVRENIAYGDINATADEQSLKRAIDRAEADFLYKLPKGLDSYVDRWMEEDEASAQELSGGQWQRLALARSFFRDSPILILDEPTSAIDALAESRIFKKLLKEEDKTIITISHRLTTVRQADVVYMFEEGKLVESGTAEELIAKKGKFYRMFESQI